MTLYTVHLKILETETWTEYIPRNTYQKLPSFIPQNAEFYSLSNDSNFEKKWTRGREGKRKKWVIKSRKYSNDQLKFHSVHAF